MKYWLPILVLLAMSQMAFWQRETPLMDLPDHFPRPSYTFSRNPLDTDKIELGRVLFYDPILSRDSTISCATCHSPYNAFAHTDHDLSHGIEGTIGTRNAPPLFNLAWSTSFMWDGAINHLDMQALAPISHPGEMGEEMGNVVEKLKRHDRYDAMLGAAFGKEDWQGAEVLLALAQFQLTLVSSNTRYDQVRRGEAEFAEQEAKGYELFQQNCNACHAEPLFTNQGFADNGLPVDTTLNDWGRAKISGQSTDSLAFKVPSLRNLKFTPPYMHDGRFQSLSQVLKHYTDGTVARPGLAPEIRGGIQLDPRERTDLIAFLLTLNDSEFVFNPRHQFPRDFFLKGEGK